MEEHLIRFDASGALRPEFAIEPNAIAAVREAVVQARREILDVDLALWLQHQPVPEQKRPLDTAFIEWPADMLASYQRDRRTSELGRIIGAAKRLRDLVDRVVILGIGGSCNGALALFHACCQPYYNELTRGERGGRPRVYFEGNNLDNDATQALLHLLRNAHSTDRLEKNWAIIAVSKSGETVEIDVALRVFFRALRDCLPVDARAGEYLIPICGTSGALAAIAEACQCTDRLEIPEGIGGRFSIFTAAGLLPAAVMGLDVVKLLEGAVAMTEHFRQADPATNVVLNFVAVNRLWETRGAITRVLSIWNKSLEQVGWWYDQLVAESLGKQGEGQTPLTVVNTRDLHSRHQQHQEGRRDKLINNLAVGHWRFDPLTVGASLIPDVAGDRLERCTFPQLIDTARRATDQALQKDLRPTTTIFLPQVNEFYLGQLFQMLMLATVVEGRVRGINPYGQPGVEEYKRIMHEQLESGQPTAAR